MPLSEIDRKALKECGYNAVRSVADRFSDLEVQHNVELYAGPCGIAEMWRYDDKKFIISQEVISGCGLSSDELTAYISYRIDELKCSRTHNYMGASIAPVAMAAVDVYKIKDEQRRTNNLQQVEDLLASQTGRYSVPQAVAPRRGFLKYILAAGVTAGVATKVAADHYDNNDMDKLIASAIKKIEAYNNRAKPAESPGLY